MQYQASVIVHEVEMSDAEEKAWRVEMAWLYGVLLKCDEESEVSVAREEEGG